MAVPFKTMTTTSQTMDETTPATTPSSDSVGGAAAGATAAKVANVLASSVGGLVLRPEITMFRELEQSRLVHDDDAS